VTVRDIDRGYAKLLQQVDRLGRPGGITTSVGIHSEEGAEGHPTNPGMSVVEVAALSEFGTATQPPRSYVRAVVDERQGDIEQSLLRASEKVARGEVEIVTAFGAVGLGVRDQMVERMSATEALDDDTVEQKGSAEPLLGTETLRNAMLVRVNGVQVT